MLMIILWYLFLNVRLNFAVKLCNRLIDEGYYYDGLFRKMIALNRENWYGLKFPKYKDYVK